MKIIECEHWEDCGVANGGCCAHGVFERPSFGVCRNLCKYNTSLENPEPIEGIEKLPLYKRVMKNIKSYVEAEASLANMGELDSEQYEARLNMCRSCEHLKKTYDEVGHCKACGCGISKRAALTVKAKMPLSTCPRNKWQPIKMTKG